MDILIQKYPCPYQDDSNDGFLYCTLPLREYDGETYKLYRGRTEIQIENCEKCGMGVWWRKIRCPHLSGEGEIRIATDGKSGRTFDWVRIRRFRCSKLPGQTMGSDKCPTCTIRESADIETNVSESLNFLENHGFFKTKADFEKARTELHQPDTTAVNTKTVIRESANALEATLKKAIEAYGTTSRIDIPLGPLWKEYKSILDLSQSNIFGKTVDTLVDGVKDSKKEGLREIRN
jgi:hypothetical protein